MKTNHFKKFLSAGVAVTFLLTEIIPLPPAYGDHEWNSNEGVQGATALPVVPVEQSSVSTSSESVSSPTSLDFISQGETPLSAPAVQVSEIDGGRLGPSPQNMARTVLPAITQAEINTERSASETSLARGTDGRYRLHYRLDPSNPDRNLGAFVRFSFDHPGTSQIETPLATSAELVLTLQKSGGNPGSAVLRIYTANTTYRLVLTGIADTQKSWQISLQNLGINLRQIQGLGLQLIRPNRGAVREGDLFIGLGDPSKQAVTAGLTEGDVGTLPAGLFASVQGTRGSTGSFGLDSEGRIEFRYNTTAGGKTTLVLSYDNPSTSAVRESFDLTVGGRFFVLDLEPLTSLPGAKITFTDDQGRTKFLNLTQLARNQERFHIISTDVLSLYLDVQRITKIELTVGARTAYTNGNLRIRTHFPEILPPDIRFSPGVTAESSMTLSVPVIPRYELLCEGTCTVTRVGNRHRVVLQFPEDGFHTFSLIHRDSLGNQSFPLTFSWERDSTPPHSVVEQSDSQGIIGWTIDQEATEFPVAMQVTRSNGEVLWSGAANQPRLDLVEQGLIPDPNHGFNIPFSALQSQGLPLVPGTYSLNLRFQDPRTGIWGTRPVTLTLPVSSTSYIPADVLIAGESQLTRVYFDPHHSDWGLVSANNDRIADFSQSFFSNAQGGFEGYIITSLNRGQPRFILFNASNRSSHAGSYLQSDVNSGFPFPLRQYLEAVARVIGEPEDVSANDLIFIRDSVLLPSDVAPRSLELRTSTLETLREAYHRLGPEAPRAAKEALLGTLINFAPLESELDPVRMNQLHDTLIDGLGFLQDSAHGNLREAIVWAMHYFEDNPDIPLARIEAALSGLSGYFSDPVFLVRYGAKYGQLLYLDLEALALDLRGGIVEAAFSLFRDFDLYFSTFRDFPDLIAFLRDYLGAYVYEITDRVLSAAFPLANLDSLRHRMVIEWSSLFSGLADLLFELTTLPVYASRWFTPWDLFRSVGVIARNFVENDISDINRVIQSLGLTGWAESIFRDFGNLVFDGTEALYQRIHGWLSLYVPQTIRGIGSIFVKSELASAPSADACGVASPFAAAHYGLMGLVTGNPACDPEPGFHPFHHELRHWLDRVLGRPTSPVTDSDHRVRRAVFGMARPVIRDPQTGQVIDFGDHVDSYGENSEYEYYATLQEFYMTGGLLLLNYALNLFNEADLGRRRTTLLRAVLEIMEDLVSNREVIVSDGDQAIARLPVRRNANGDISEITVPVDSLKIQFFYSSNTACVTHYRIRNAVTNALLTTSYLNPNATSSQCTDPLPEPTSISASAVDSHTSHYEKSAPWFAPFSWSPIAFGSRVTEIEYRRRRIFPAYGMGARRYEVRLR